MPHRFCIIVFLFSSLGIFLNFFFNLFNDTLIVSASGNSLKLGNVTIATIEDKYFLDTGRVTLEGSNILTVLDNGHKDGDTKTLQIYLELKSYGVDIQ